MTKPTPEAVALKAARALSVKNPPHDDWCSFSYAVGEKLFELGNARDGVGGFVTGHLVFGILDAQAREQARLDEKFAALDAAAVAEENPEREARALRARDRERLRELIRLVIVDGKPVK
jgi:hypothetical protein